MSRARLDERITSVGPGVIDVHTHAIDPRLADTFAESGDSLPVVRRTGDVSAAIYFGDELYREVDERCWDAEARLHDMDAEGVAAQLVAAMPGTTCYDAGADDGTRLAQLQNDYLADLVAEAPNRFFGLAAVPLQDPDAALAELDRCMNQLGFVGVQVGTRVRGDELAHPRFTEFFERAASWGAVVFVHPVDRFLDDRLRSSGLAFGVGMPSETGTAAAAWLVSDRPTRMPNLRVVLAHGGGTLPAIVGRVSHGQQILTRTPEDALASAQVANLWCDSLTYDQRALTAAADCFTPGHVLLGSDYPFLAREVPVGAALEKFPGAMHRTAIGRDNALDLLRGVHAAPGDLAHFSGASEPVTQ